MSKYELYFIVSITALCYVFCYIFENLISLFILNTLLVCFYILFVFGKLPDFFYKNGECPTSKAEIICIWGGIGFLLCCWLIYFFTSYYRLIGRIGLAIILLVSSGVMLITNMKKFLGTIPHGTFYQSRKYFFRVILLIFTNIYVIPCCAYSYYASYDQNGRLIYKSVKDGVLNEYNTEYKASSSCYVTHATIDDTDDKDIKHLEYNIYYKKYPDVIEKIDTIKIVKREKKNHEKE